MFSEKNQTLNPDLFDLKDYENYYQFDEIEKKRVKIDYFLETRETPEDPKYEYLRITLEFLDKTQTFLAATNYQYFLADIKNNPKILIQNFEKMSTDFNRFTEKAFQTANSPQDKQFMTYAIKYFTEVIARRIENLKERLDFKNIQGWDDSLLVKMIENYANSDLSINRQRY